MLVEKSTVANPEASAKGLTRDVKATTSTGRKGAYYLPSAYESRALPLLVFLHGSGSKGSLAILRSQAQAEQARFIVLAPDSVSVAGVWMIGERPGETSEDYRHVMACVREIQTIPHLQIDLEHVLAAGFSVAGNAAAYVGTHEALFTDLAVLHGHITPAAIGPRRPRTWVSAGDRDRARTPEYMKSVTEHLEQQGFASVSLRSFSADHTLQDKELDDLVAWWLSRLGSVGSDDGVRRVGCYTRCFLGVVPSPVPPAVDHYPADNLVSPTRF